MHVCVDAFGLFGCSFVSSTVKERSRKFLQNVILSKKSLDVFDQCEHGRTRN